MKKYIIILLTFLIVPYLKGQISTDISYYQQFPTYQKVLQHYFSYNNIDVQKLYYLDFVKKPSGWFVIERSIPEWPKELTETMVWNAANQEFQIALASPDYVSLAQDIDPTMSNYLIQQMMRKPNVKYLDAAPVYGYDEYEQDLFQIFNNKKLSADQLEILARAYSSICDKMMKRSISEKQNKTFDNYFNSFNKKDISQKDIDDYVIYAQKAIATFKELSERFPDFMTAVGNIKLKYWNEHMAHYYDLILLQQTEAAKQFINQPIFDDFLVKYGKNLLNSCAKEAILITYGDLDTYISLYVQSKYSFRKDVSIMNTSLAALDYYIQYQMRENKLPHSISMSFYKNYIKEFGLLENVSDTTSFAKFTTEAQAQPTDYMKEVNGDKYITIPSVAVSIPIRNKANIVLRYGGTFAPEKELIARFPRTALNRSQFFTFDVITTNQWKRPIYFSMGTDGASRLYLRPYLKWEGLVFQLMPQLGWDKDRATLMSNMFHYEMSKPASMYTQKSTPNSAYLQYLYLFYETVRDANAQLKEKESKEMMETLLKYFPPNEVSYQDFSAFFADNCYRLKRFEEADMIILDRAKDVRAKALEPNLTDYMKRKLVSEKAYILGIAGRSKDEGFLDKIKGILGD